MLNALEILLRPARSVDLRLMRREFTNMDLDDAIKAAPYYFHEVEIVKPLVGEIVMKFKPVSKATAKATFDLLCK